MWPAATYMSSRKVFERDARSDAHRQPRGCSGAIRIDSTWANGISDPGAVRSHYTHVVDVGATILELAGIPQAKSIDGIELQPYDGVTFGDSFGDPAAPERHTQQYYEILGNRAMYKDGWLFCQRLQRIPWELDPDQLRNKFGPTWDPEGDLIELYYLPEDFTQSKNIAADHQEKVQELRELFWAEAENNNVLPLLGGLTSFFGMVPPIPERTRRSSSAATSRTCRAG